MPIDYLTSVVHDATALADVARKAPRDTPVAGCPGWDLDQLVVHLGRIHRWVINAIDAGGDNPGKPPPGPHDAADYPDWLAEGARIMAEKLRGLDPGATVWNFSGTDLTAAFWARRQALETAVHRWDGEAAAGAAAPIDAALAVDGIDEIFTVFAPLRRAGAAPLSLEGSVHLHATDADGEWTLSAPGGELTVERGHAKGDVAVRGPASTLYLMLWRRVPPSNPDLTRFGDEAVLDRWLASGVP
ncbi:MAG: hypothetical protein QOD72_2622 [Acidimicrobiaceae bacterium]|jgi:uncharacterized protein (TIGR03083 family)|nr:hypothetical protein [Acidimicrobiaceae bacterium]